MAAMPVYSHHCCCSELGCDQSQREFVKFPHKSKNLGGFGQQSNNSQFCFQDQ